MLNAQSSKLNAILSSTYFGPVQWYQKLNRYGHVYIEQHDHFIKQTYRNRCIIATTQGQQALTVPVEKYENDVTEMKDIRISDHGNWRHLHWNALSSAYGESPFFEFYADDIRPFFEKQWTYLLDFNMAITEKMCELLEIEPSISLTPQYSVVAAPCAGHQPPVRTNEQQENLITVLDGGRHKAGHYTDSKGMTDYIDFREVIRPKHPGEDKEFSPTPYYQVYKEKFGFQPNLSILDLLFNMGNEAVLYL